MQSARDTREVETQCQAATYHLLTTTGSHVRAPVYFVESSPPKTMEPPLDVDRHSPMTSGRDGTAATSSEKIVGAYVGLIALFSLAKPMMPAMGGWSNEWGGIWHTMGGGGQRASTASVRSRPRQQCDTDTFNLDVDKHTHAALGHEQNTPPEPHGHTHDPPVDPVATLSGSRCRHRPLRTWRVT